MEEIKLALLQRTHPLEIQKSQIDLLEEYARKLTKFVSAFSRSTTHSFKIKDRYYSSISDVLDQILTKFKKYFPRSPIQLTYAIDPLTGKVTFTSTHGKVAILSPTDYLTKHLGFQSEYYRVLNGTCHLTHLDGQGKSRAYLDDIFQIFVYSDIIDYQTVGNTKKPLMGVIPVKGKHGDQESWTFNPLQFGAIARRSFSTIEMQLCTPTGALVPYLSGDTMSRIQFRRRII